MSELIETFCVLDRQPIPPERAVRRSNTCSTECARRLIAIRKVQRDQRYCRHCGRPSTPEQRLEFLAWRKAQPGWAGKRGRPKKQLPVASCQLPVVAPAMPPHPGAAGTKADAPSE